MVKYYYDVVISDDYEIEIEINGNIAIVYIDGEKVDEFDIEETIRLLVEKNIRDK